MFIHSLWTKPMIANRRDFDFKQNIIITTVSNAVSAAYVIHNGGNIKLYTDGFGIDMLEFIPYTDIEKLTVPTNVPTANWAVGKFLTLEKMSLGDIHIDGDVYLKSEKLLNTITDDSYDFVVQSIEDDRETLSTYYKEVRDVMINNDIKPLTCQLIDTPSYNCGTVGFFNKELKTKYLNEYFVSLKQIMMNTNIQKQFKIDPNLIPDLVMEQQYLYQISDNYKVHNLLGHADEIYENAVKINYQHVLGGFKTTQLNNIFNELKYIDFNLYNKALKQINYLV